MKILKAKTSHPKKQIFQISDLNYNLYYTNNNSKLVNGAENIFDNRPHLGLPSYFKGVKI